MEASPRKPQSLAEEIGQNRPFASPAIETFLNLIKTREKLGTAHDLLLKREGLSVPKYNVMRILRGAGPEGLAMCVIASRMISREPDITRLIERMRKEGLVARSPCDRDRRIVRVTLTALGAERVSNLEAPLNKLTNGLFAHLTTHETETLNDLLFKLRHGGDDDGDGA